MTFKYVEQNVVLKPNTLLYAIEKFYSRLLVRKLSCDEQSKLWKAESLLKLCIKRESDTNYLKKGQDDNFKI